ncbi:S-adenosyl-L-methionine-dependent methyltransferase [Cubamyces lactineus]|nr:S-adenosyl-L-methionine-dependent methyltransferase [Cubamyces lactineus]
MATSTAASLLARLSRAIGHESAQHELRWMRQALRSPPSRIPPSAQTVEDMVERRIRGEPLQYILGSQPFGPLTLAVRPPVLIPRPETEDWALNLAQLIRSQPPPARPLNVLDLCTGTGCIPLLLCRELPPGWAHATGVDISEDAVALAKENARLNDVPVLPLQLHSRHASSRETMANTFTPILADLMQQDVVREAGLEPSYDVITSNPPYIPKAEYDRLDPSVRDYEDVRALLGDPEGAVPPTLPEAERDKGLSFYHRIAELVRDEDLLGPNGMLVLEVGDGQADDVASILKRRTDLGNIDVWNDPWGKARVVFARR